MVAIATNFDVPPIVIAFYFFPFSSFSSKFIITISLLVMFMSLFKLPSVIISISSSIILITFPSVPPFIVSVDFISVSISSVFYLPSEIFIIFTTIFQLTTPIIVFVSSPFILTVSMISVSQLSSILVFSILTFFIVVSLIVVSIISFPAKVVLIPSILHFFSDILISIIPLINSINISSSTMNSPNVVIPISVVSELSLNIFITFLSSI